MATQTNASAASHTDPFNRKYKILSKIGEGSYSEVLKCKNRDTGSTYACKRLKHCYRSWNQVNDIPEIVTLRKLARHPNILQMVEIHFLRPLFPGSSELDQINRVHNVLGPPPQKILVKFSKHAEIERDYSRHTSKQARLDTIKRVLGEMKNANYDWYFTGKDPKGVETLLPTHVTPEAKDLLKHLLQYDPDSRPSSHRALQHAYFKELREQAQRAAREKIPSITGPIVTIVGDEGGLEVTADDNANPVDLATLGDAKLKLKAPVMRRTSEVKEVKDNPTGLKNRS
ncbi:unnamed protein product [Allacma fusca]|uniref:Protein kinase domain-containing protein n=1 Tax=Allacma fusca TaxID=39272 RepID=A0A8J2PXE7_9HEXA|nr:unnamed protein product [Allacma fusca]